LQYRARVINVANMLLQRAGDQHRQCGHDVGSVFAYSCLGRLAGDDLGPMQRVFVGARILTTRRSKRTAGCGAGGQGFPTCFAHAPGDSARASHLTRFCELRSPRELRWLGARREGPGSGQAVAFAPGSWRRRRRPRPHVEGGRGRGWLPEADGMGSGRSRIAATSTLLGREGSRHE
jgi:hypothetical protein